MNIKGQFFDGSAFEGEVPFRAETKTPMVLSKSDPPGIQVAVVAQGATATFSACADDCDGVDETHHEYLGDGVGRISATLHLHPRHK